MNYRLEAFFVVILMTLFIGILAGVGVLAFVLIASGFYWLAGLAALFLIVGMGMADAAMTYGESKCE